MDMSNESYLAKAIAWAKKKRFEIISAKAEGYQEPKSFFNKTKNEYVQPDLTCRNSLGSKHYATIALKSDNPQKAITKWKFFSTLAAMKEGKLHLLTPKGHKKYVSDMINQYKISAQIQSI